MRLPVTEWLLQFEQETKPYLLTSLANELLIKRAGI